MRFYETRKLNESGLPAVRQSGRDALIKTT